MSDLKTIEVVKVSEPPTRPPHRDHQWRWQWLLAPLMGISVVLHLALLFVPLPERLVEEEVVEEEAPSEIEEEAIDILSLSDIAAPEPPSEPPPEPPQPEPSQPTPPPTGAVPPPSDPQPTQELPSEEEFYENELPIEDGRFEDAPPAFDPVASQQAFVGNLSNLGVGDFSENIPALTPKNFMRTESIVCFLDPSGGTVPGVRTAQLLDKSPQTLLTENLPQAYQSIGITFEELEPFCGERYVQAVTAAGEPFMKFSMVELQGSTLLVMWETPPQ